MIRTAILSDLPLYQLRYWNYSLLRSLYRDDGPWPEPHFGLLEALSSPSLSQARVWLLLVSLAMAARGSLLKFNMVLNQIYKCLGVLWKTHTQAALAKPGSVYVYVHGYVWVCVSVSENGWVKACSVCACLCVWNKRENCVRCLSVLSGNTVCVRFFFFLALIPPVRQRFNKHHTRIKGTSLYTHTLAVSSYCSMYTLCTCT